MTSEVRRDPWSGAEVVLAPGRLSIGATKPSGLPAPSGRCPFCPGHEADAETTVESIGEPWMVRAVGNKFPLVSDAMPHARGAHEVIVETAAHDGDLPDLDHAAMVRVLTMYRSRARSLGARSTTEAVVLFRNRGRRAGSSQPHPHAQIAALDFVPPHVRARDAIASGDADLLGRTLDAERTGGRVVIESSTFITFAPYASSRAHEVRIAPRTRIERLAHVDDAGVNDLADHLRRSLRALRTRMGLSDYNVLVRDPAIETRDAFFSIEILPRTGGDAGFELHTGASICLVAPEETAAALREIDARS
jgi:UDPglucose--hexose-1-phosphate uridylyltransferase